MSVSFHVFYTRFYSIIDASTAIPALLSEENAGAAKYPPNLVLISRCIIELNDTARINHRVLRRMRRKIPSVMQETVSHIYQCNTARDLFLGNTLFQHPTALIFYAGQRTIKSFHARTYRHFIGTSARHFIQIFSCRKRQS